jgi:hypothetical protein
LEQAIEADKNRRLLEKEADKNRRLLEKEERAERRQISLSGVVKDLWIYSVLMIVGLIPYSIAIKSDGFRIFNFLLLLGLSFVIAGLPTLIKFAKGGFTKDFFYYQHVEMVTKYKDGSKSSDGGAFSLPINMGAWLLVGLILIPLIVLFNILVWGYLCVKYVICLLTTKDKPLSVYSAFIPVVLLVIFALIVF